MAANSVETFRIIPSPMKQSEESQFVSPSKKPLSLTERNRIRELEEVCNEHIVSEEALRCEVWTLQGKIASLENEVEDGREVMRRSRVEIGNLKTALSNHRLAEQRLRKELAESLLSQKRGVHLRDASMIKKANVEMERMKSILKSYATSLGESDACASTMQSAVYKLSREVETLKAQLSDSRKQVEALESIGTANIPSADFATLSDSDLPTPLQWRSVLTELSYLRSRASGDVRCEAAAIQGLSAQVQTLEVQKADAESEITRLREALNLSTISMSKLNAENIFVNSSGGTNIPYSESVVSSVLGRKSQQDVSPTGGDGQQPQRQSRANSVRTVSVHGMSSLADAFCLGPSPAALAPAIVVKGQSRRGSTKRGSDDANCTQQ